MPFGNEIESRIWPISRIFLLILIGSWMTFPRRRVLQMKPVDKSELCFLPFIQRIQRFQERVCFPAKLTLAQIAQSVEKAWKLISHNPNKSHAHADTSDNKEWCSNLAVFFKVSKDRIVIRDKIQHLRQSIPPFHRLQQSFVQLWERRIGPWR